VRVEAPISKVKTVKNILNNYNNYRILNVDYFSFLIKDCNTYGAFTGLILGNNVCSRRQRK
jgi:hypothetical protein